MNNIVIATDGSSGGCAAVSGGVELARLLGARVTFVSVWQVTSDVGEPYTEWEPGDGMGDARRALELAMREADRFGVIADYEIVEGDPADEILRTARYREASAIVVGSRGLRAVTGRRLGSVSKALIRDAPMPVLVVKETRASSAVPAADAEHELTRA